MQLKGIVQESTAFNKPIVLNASNSLRRAVWLEERINFWIIVLMISLFTILILDQFLQKNFTLEIIISFIILTIGSFFLYTYYLKIISYNYIPASQIRFDSLYVHAHYSFDSVCSLAYLDCKIRVKYRAISKQAVIYIHTGPGQMPVYVMDVDMSRKNYLALTQELATRIHNSKYHESPDPARN